ncbi:amidase [Cladophialophora yegresii CBS 114405]|uniref:Amidase n=1 Tax=Cladophialophora yegresii CBS 114405 TaxID=1182544 RepID=W9W1N6_9EURO|nr:amidase [Cladophialophora yegresii CBS 114405]EXJ61843.1 amidase [Cladophialophora yegresii CBS 114405]
MSTAGGVPASAFLNRPPVRKGPDVPYKNEAGSNPVLRGVTLAVVSKVVSSSNWIQRIFWTLNRFDKLKDTPYLDEYEIRLDPTVWPRHEPAGPLGALTELPAVQPRASSTNYYTCADYHELYKSGKLTPSDVVEQLLLLIRRDVQPAGRYSVAFIDSKVDLVRAAAKASTERYQAGKPLSELDGVPLAVKDEVDLAGYRTTKGSRLDFTDKTDGTAWCVQKWQDAGAVIIGKTNMHEVGLDTTNNNQTWGTPLNPHNNGYYTGGSSGGSAFAIAAGIVPIALGVDGGGSIRLPAAFCGIYGLKTTHGRVSPRVSKDWIDNVAVHGPMASSIDDLALGYRVMAQPDLCAARSSGFPSSLVNTSFTASTGKKYLAIDRTWVDRSDKVVLDMFNAAVDGYVKNQGYEVVEINIPYIPEGQKAHALTILSEVRSQLTREKIKKLSWHNQLLLNVAGGHATAQDFMFAQKLRNLLMCHLAWLWEKYPGVLILTPTTPCAGWKIGHPTDLTSGQGVSDGDMSLRSMEYVYLANFTGNPAISCPMGYTDQNVPVGLMAMGDWCSEEQLIAFAREGESFLAGADGIRRPKDEQNWIDILAETKPSQ